MRQFSALIGLWDALDDGANAARALHGLGNALRRQNIEEAERAFQQSLERSSLWVMTRCGR